MLLFLDSLPACNVSKSIPNFHRNLKSNDQIFSNNIWRWSIPHRLPTMTIFSSNKILEPKNKALSCVYTQFETCKTCKKHDKQEDYLYNSMAGINKKHSVISGTPKYLCSCSSDNAQPHAQPRHRHCCWKEMEHFDGTKKITSYDNISLWKAHIVSIFSG